MHNLSKPLRECFVIISGGLFIGTVIWMLLLIASVQTLKNLPEMNSTYIMLGPLVLNAISKRETYEAFAISLSFEVGFFWYLAGWVMCSFGVWFGHKTGRPKKQ